MIGDEELSGILWLNRNVSTDLFLYYLKEAIITDCFHFAGLDLREKPLRKVRWRDSQVIQMPKFEREIEKRTKRLGDVMAWGCERIYGASWRLAFIE